MERDGWKTAETGSPCNFLKGLCESFFESWCNSIALVSRAWIGQGLLYIEEKKKQQASSLLFNPNKIIIMRIKFHKNAYQYNAKMAANFNTFSLPFFI